MILRDGTTSEKLLHDFLKDSNFKILLEKDYGVLRYVLLKPGFKLKKPAHSFDLRIYHLIMQIYCYYAFLDC